MSSQPNNQPPSELTPVEKFNHYVPLFSRIIFALILMFAIVGAILKKGDIQPIYIIVVTVVVWTCTRIMTEAMDAIKLLQLIKKTNATGK